MFQAIQKTLSELWTGINNISIIVTEDYNFSIGQVLIGTCMISIIFFFIIIVIRGKGASKNE